MNAKDKKLFVGLVEIINNNMKIFHKTGCALKKIRDKRLYLSEYDSFEEFCLNHLKLSRAYAYRQITAYEVIKNLTIVNIPLNESQTRPLAKLKPNQQNLAWQHALDMAQLANRPVLTKDVIQAVHAVTGKDLNTLDEKKPKNKFVSKKFKISYESFFSEIKKAKNQKWKNTSKATINEHLQFLITFLKDKN
jgi:hypothetical protein